MLVLTRKLQEKIVFPGANISVQVVRIKPGKVGLGIEAPSEVTILREEIPDRLANWGAPKTSAPSAQPKSATSDPATNLSRKLQALSMGLGLARLQLRLGQSQNVEAVLDRMHQDIQSLLGPFSVTAVSAPSDATAVPAIDTRAGSLS
jgi:carbon storage regulator